MSAETLLTVEEAASRLKVSKHTLNRWRVTGEGPPFVKYGPRLVRYIDRVLAAQRMPNRLDHSAGILLRHLQDERGYPVLLRGIGRAAAELRDSNRNG